MTVTEENVDALTAETQLPVVVKPIASGSSIGVFIAKTRQELRHALTESIRLDDIKKATGSQIRAVHFNDHGDLVAAKA